MTNTVGYIINHPAGPEGQQGIGYDYVLAGSGLYVQAESPQLVARVRVSTAQVKGLEPVDEKVQLRHGLIPGFLFQLALDACIANHRQERFYAIRWQGGRYELVEPRQEGTAASLSYNVIQDAVLEMHSNGQMQAFFSSTDNADELGFRIYGVIGRLDQPVPEVNFRVGVYGHWAPVSWSELFSGPAPAVKFTGPYGGHEVEDVLPDEPILDR